MDTSTAPAPFKIVCEYSRLTVENIAKIEDACAQMLALKAETYGVKVTLIDADGYIVPASEIKEVLIAAVNRLF